MYRHYDLSSVSQVVALNCIAPDNYGMMWIGTSKGLYNFDGSYFHSQALKDSNTNAVTALEADNDLLSIGFSDGKLMHRTTKIWGKDIYLDTSFSSPITAIAENAAGEIWVSTYGKGLFQK